MYLLNTKRHPCSKECHIILRLNCFNRRVAYLQRAYTPTLHHSNASTQHRCTKIAVCSHISHSKNEMNERHCKDVATDYPLAFSSRLPVACHRNHSICQQLLQLRLPLLPKTLPQTLFALEPLCDRLMPLASRLLPLACPADRTFAKLLNQSRCRLPPAEHKGSE